MKGELVRNSIMLHIFIHKVTNKSTRLKESYNAGPSQWRMVETPYTNLYLEEDIKILMYVG